MNPPDGLDIHPEPCKSVRISRRAGMAILLVVVGFMIAFAYGGYRRTENAPAAVRDAGLPRNVSPATQAGSEFTKIIPEGIAPLTRKTVAELQPPDLAATVKAQSLCGSNPQTGQPYRFNPQTGQPRDGLPQERLVVRQALPPPLPPLPPVPVVTAHEPTPEERRVAALYAREQEARLAPTSIRATAGASAVPALTSTGRSGADDLAQVAALTQALTRRHRDVALSVPPYRQGVGILFRDFSKLNSPAH